MRKAKTRTPRLQPYFTRRIGFVLAGLWLTAMILLTVGTAQYVLSEFAETGYDFPEYVETAGRLDEYYPSEESEARGEWLDHPGGADYCMLEGIARSTLYNSTPDLSSYPGEAWFSGIYRSTYSMLNTAVLFIDSEENILHQNGDFFYFYYQTADSWAAQKEGSDGYAWVDLSDEEDSRYSFLRTQYVGLGAIDLMYDWEAVRMTGYFDGSRFEPLSMALADYRDYAEAVEQLSPSVSEEVDYAIGSSAADNTISDSGGGSEYTMSQLDNLGLIEWEERYDYAADAPAGKALVTIYGRYPEMRLYDGKSIRYQGQVYSDLAALLRQEGYYRSEEGSLRFHQRTSQYSLFNSVLFGVRTYWDFSDYDHTSGEPWPDPAVTMVTAVQASPLLLAAGYLRNVYLITAALTLMAFFWLRSLVKKHVAQPLAEINAGIADGWLHLPTLRYHAPYLAEPHTLSRHYQATQERLRQNANEINRLNAALRYAETAEENRRQMTSHIAHELKTPLAVIHSYAEGLQEHIAEEKREKYLEVILSESERMDTMVLEMLDLSRLEAGRVKLSRDEFSLIDLCRAVFDKLDMALQAKHLQVEYLCYCSAVVTADENRIRQVIENFATNAIKHTPAGGEIRVRVTAGRDGITFAMENDGQPLPAEVLGKVWDSFWRQDESRSSPGTGLGLAIAKSIITLHGGECSACNTRRGVEFRFRI